MGPNECRNNNNNNNDADHHQRDANRDLNDNINNASSSAIQRGPTCDPMRGLRIAGSAHSHRRPQLATLRPKRISVLSGRETISTSSEVQDNNNNNTKLPSNFRRNNIHQDKSPVFLPEAGWASRGDGEGCCCCCCCCEQNRSSQHNNVNIQIDRKSNSKGHFFSKVAYNFVISNQITSLTGVSVACAPESGGRGDTLGAYGNRLREVPGEAAVELRTLMDGRHRGWSGREHAHPLPPSSLSEQLDRLAPTTAPYATTASSQDVSQSFVGPHLVAPKIHSSPSEFHPFDFEAQNRALNDLQEGFVDFRPNQRIYLANEGAHLPVGFELDEDEELLCAQTSSASLEDKHLEAVVSNIHKLNKSCHLERIRPVDPLDGVNLRSWSPPSQVFEEPQQKEQNLRISTSELDARFYNSVAGGANWEADIRRDQEQQLAFPAIDQRANRCSSSLSVPCEPSWSRQVTMRHPHGQRKLHNHQLVQQQQQPAACPPQWAVQHVTGDIASTLQVPSGAQIQFDSRESFGGRRFVSWSRPVSPSVASYQVASGSNEWPPYETRARLSNQKEPLFGAPNYDDNLEHESGQHRHPRRQRHHHRQLPVSQSHSLNRESSHNGLQDNYYHDDDDLEPPISLVPAELRDRIPAQIAEQMSVQASNFVLRNSSLGFATSGCGKHHHKQRQRRRLHEESNPEPSERHSKRLQVRRTLRVKIKKSRPILGIAIEGGFNVSGQLLPRIVCVHEDGAAYQCGKLRASDLILEVNGVSTVNMTHDEIAKTIASAYYQNSSSTIEFLIGESVPV